MLSAAVVDMEFWRILGEELHRPPPFGVPQLRSGHVQTEDLTVCKYHRPLVTVAVPPGKIVSGCPLLCALLGSPISHVIFLHIFFLSLASGKQCCGCSVCLTLLSKNTPKNSTARLLSRPCNS